MELLYCRRCGEELVPQDDLLWACKNRHSTYKNASPCVGVFIFDSSGSLIVARRGINPGIHMLDAFGGFIDVGETAEQAALRELSEEASLDESDITPLQYLCTAPSLYDFEDESRPVLSVLFWTKLRDGVIVIPQDDVEEAFVEEIDKLKVSDFYGDDIKYGLKILQQNVKEMVI